jgi:hypothetical protein
MLGGAARFWQSCAKMFGGRKFAGVASQGIETLFEPPK